MVVLLLALIGGEVHAYEGLTPGPGPEAEPRNVRFNHIRVTDGLSHAAVTAIAQDHRGFMWFGTQDGLNRYDGQQIVTFLRDSNEPGQLPHNWIWTLHSDSNGNLWVGTDGGGLAVLDPQSETFSTYRSRKDHPGSLQSDRIRTLFEDRAGILWIGTDGGGVTRYDPTTGGFRTYRHDPDDQFSLPSDSVLAILEDPEGFLWVGTNGGGLARLDHASGRFQRYEHDPADPNSLSNDRVRALLLGRDGWLWVGTYEGGLNRLHVASGVFERFDPGSATDHGFSSKRVRSLFRDRAGTLWVGTENGLFAWVPKQRQFVRYGHVSGDPDSLSDDRVSALFQDAGGVLWVGTFGDLNAWNYLSEAFEYTVSSSYGGDLSGNVVTSITKDDRGDLWVGTYDGGLSRMMTSSGKSEVFRHDPADNATLPDDRIMAMLANDEHIWIGTRNGGLVRADRRSGEFVRYQHDAARVGSISSNRISALSMDDDGTLWVGTYGGGLNRLDADSDRFHVYRHDQEVEATIGSDRILAVYRDKLGTLWVGTEGGGLNRFDPLRGEFQRYLHDPLNPKSIGSNTAWRIVEDASGSLWIGTLDGGLNHLEWIDRNSNECHFHRFTRKDGLLSDTVYGLERDGEGNLWLSSARGLTRFDPLTKAVRHFDRSSGLRDNEFNFGAHFQDETGRLYFGGPNGMVEFHPKRLTKNAHRPPVVVNADIGGEVIAVGHSNDSVPVKATLDYRDRRVTFRFAALDFASPRKNIYRYRLGGFEENWRDSGEYPQATYTNLPAGSYTFEAMAANNDGLASERPAQVLLRVAPAPWRTGWAYASYGVVVCVAMLSIWRHQRRKVRVAAEQRLELSRMVDERTSELRKANDELEVANTKLVEASVTDSLTGLKNRRYLDTAIGDRIAAIDRRCSEHQVPPSPHIAFDISPRMFFMMIDLDGFKEINDEHGHHAGDQALIQVSGILQTCCRPTDLVIRWGGDEFLIIGECGADRAVEKLAENIRMRLAETQYTLGGGNIGRMSGSIGYALYPFAPLKPELMGWEKVATLADHAAYVAKRNGRNAWVGLYGKAKAGREELDQVRGNIETLLKMGYVELRTSVEGDLTIEQDLARRQVR
ncbi:MAG: two-component regulator propeller domain-containing protein [Sedimenticolaceae bacterium]